MASSFLSRWSQRKLEGEEAEINNQESQDELEQSSDTAHLVLEETASGSDQENNIASLLASQAEQAVKKAALRKLFLSGEFSEVDRLNDYDHDYKAVNSLASDVAEKLRNWVNETDKKEDDQTAPPNPDAINSEQPERREDAVLSDSLPTEDESYKSDVRQNNPQTK